MRLEEAQNHQKEIEDLARQLSSKMASLSDMGFVFGVQNSQAMTELGNCCPEITITCLISPCSVDMERKTIQ